MKDKKIKDKSKLKSKEKIITVRDHRGKIRYKNYNLHIFNYEKEFYTKYKLNRVGTIRYCNGYNQNDNRNADEVETANWLSTEFGWDVKLIKANDKTEGKKYVDLLSNKLWWEIKSSSSENSIDKQVEKALHQLREKNLAKIGGFILNVYEDNNFVIHKLDNTEIEEIVKSRINRSCKFECHAIIRKNKKLISILKIKKNTTASQWANDSASK